MTWRRLASSAITLAEGGTVVFAQMSLGKFDKSSFVWGRQVGVWVI